MKNATLPRRDTDKVLTLYAHYFLAGELMLKNFRKLDAKGNQGGRLSQKDRYQLPIYFFTWLGFLAVRIPLAYLLTAPALGLGLFGAWLAMAADLWVRGAFFLARFAGGRWKRARV